MSVGGWAPWLACCESGGWAVAQLRTKKQEEAALRDAASGARAPSMSNKESWRGSKKGMWSKCPAFHYGKAQMVLETLGCLAPGGPVGALTSCEFHLGCHQLWQKLLTCRDSMLAWEWVELRSLLSGADKCRGLTIPLSSFFSEGQKLQGVPWTTVMWRGFFLQVGSQECPR